MTNSYSLRIRVSTLIIASKWQGILQLVYQCQIDGILDCFSPRANDCRHFTRVSASAKIHTKNHCFICKNVDVHLPQSGEFERDQRIYKFQET